MADFQDLFSSYLKALPPTLAIATLLAVIGWKFWFQKNTDVTSDKALTSVSTGYRSLSDAQQFRIGQQDLQITRLEKLVAELQTQLSAALIEISRLRVVMESLRDTATSKNATALKNLEEG